MMEKQAVFLLLIKNKKIRTQFLILLCLIEKYNPAAIVDPMLPLVAEIAINNGVGIMYS